MADRYRRPHRRIDPARAAAFRAVQDVTMDGAYAHLAIREHTRELASQDAAFATELAQGTLRGLGSYDAIITAAGGRELADLDAEIVDVLRLVTHQLFHMRVPDHAAIATGVDLAAVEAGERTTGIVNAISRAMARRTWDEWVAHLAPDDEPARLALETCHPAWIVAEWARVLPADELAAALAADNVAPTPTLVVRPGLAEPAELGQPTVYSPFGATADAAPREVAAVRERRAGVQDEGSQMVAWALALADAPDGDWLDLCAGPGGKAALLAGLARDSGRRLLAAEKHPHRAALVAKALAGYREVPWVIAADGREGPWRDGSFARVMVDAPCTGVGALRRRPDARWRRQPADVEPLARLQRQLLTAGLRATAPGGVCAYVTCSPIAAETSEVVDSVLAEQSHVSPVTNPLPQVPGSASGDYAQLWPHRHGTDAMFLALLRIG